MAVEVIGRRQDTEWLKRRVDDLLAETQDGSRSWERVRENMVSTNYRVTALEDGEDYKVVMRLRKNIGSGFILFSHETGLCARTYMMRSDDYKPLEELGKAVFS